MRVDAMAAGPAAHAGEAISFGPFTLVIGQRLLLKDGAPVDVGARTLDTLIVLASRPNEAVSKKELMAQVWPDVVVEEGSLRFHIAVLRRTLGDGEGGQRYITTLPGRGYCFVGQVSRSDTRNAPRRPPATSIARALVLPSRLLRMVGRSDGILAVSSRLAAERFVTITGAGGVGKTTMAVAVANDLVEAFAGAVLFVDLGSLSDPNIVATSLATMLGLAVQSDDPAPSLVAYLRDKTILLIFDNCEHLVEAAAILAARIFAAAPQVHILATSREALRVEGEHIYRLDPLVCPPDDPTLTAAAALTYPAAQLFVERAAASGVDEPLSDQDAPIVASICRKLDGIALAIELAAARVGTYGLQQTADLLNERLSLLWQGQRGVPARQQTLRATMDWSYGLLDDLERQSLRRLSVFAGDFTLDAACAALAVRSSERARFTAAIDSLVSKSMVATTRVGSSVRYRLLETTRDYALEVSEPAEVNESSAAHAAYYQRWLEGSAANWHSLRNAAERTAHLADMANVRAALERTFAENGNEQLGIALASAAGSAFIAMSLFKEAHRWSERALQAVMSPNRGGREEMHLQANLGVSLMFLRGQGDAARAALDRSLRIAKIRDDAVIELQLMAPLVMFHLRVGDFRAALEHGRRGSELSKVIADPNALALAHSLLGISLTHTGDLAAARAELEAARQTPGFRREGSTYLGFDGHDLAGIFLARTLWLQGYPDQAIALTRATVEQAAAVDHPVTLSIALVWAVSVFLWVGDVDAAEEHIDWFIARAETHSLGPYLAVGRGYKGQLAVRRGDAVAGIDAIRSAMRELHAVRYELLTTAFSISLAQAHTALGQFDDATRIVDEAIAMVEENGDASYMPELLRVKGDILLASHPGSDEAERYFSRAQELSRMQGARAYELRAATDRAKVHISKGRRDDARGVLEPIIALFVEGVGTADVKDARTVLASVS